MCVVHTRGAFEPIKHGIDAIEYGESKSAYLNCYSPFIFYLDHALNQQFALLT